MLEGKNVIVVIPARGGSKRFPGKNTYPLLGKPLIAYPIEAAKRSKYADRVIVSTNDKEIAEVAKGYGAEVPFMRPDDIATDTSPVIEAIVHMVRVLEKEENFHTDYAVLLQATTPLIESKQIDEAIELAVNKNADSVVAVAEVETINHPYNVREIRDDGTARFWQYNLHYNCVGKDRPKFYCAANLWLSSYTTLTKERKLEGEKNYPLLVEAKYSSDIDFKEDLERIEILLRYERGSK